MLVVIRLLNGITKIIMISVVAISYETPRDSTTITDARSRIWNENVPRHRIENRIDRHMFANGEKMGGFLDRKKTHRGSNMEHINGRTTNLNAASSLGTSSVRSSTLFILVAPEVFKIPTFFETSFLPHSM
ncbi:hypothetical protein DICVIV_13763 [Dictyocaulus viviparus]|uniref:Uncharacterized protein n=1 Tax=Dictyocaulus viviparus TaxID=29172 RepID=A0A0D8X974_DICVI|nr:hypothetical protein DICVIV_13763 [Dictyocaulus viviparus]